MRPYNSHAALARLPFDPAHSQTPAKLYFNCDGFPKKGNNYLDSTTPIGENGGQGKLRLFSLQDIMNHFCVNQIVRLFELLELQKQSLIVLRGLSGGGSSPPESQVNACRELVKISTDLCFAVMFNDAMDRIQKLQVSKTSQLDASTWIAAIGTIQDALTTEISRRHFLAVAPDRVKYLEVPPDIFPFHITYQSHMFWGNGKNEEFPLAAPDIQAAGNCMAAECHTAAVFHAMRVAEYGLRYLAGRLKVKLTYKGKPQPVEFADWNKVIEGIKNRLVVVGKSVHNAKRQRLLAQFSELADQCTYIKDLWRNEVSHARRQFLRDESEAILSRVLGFMISVRKTMTVRKV